MGILNFRHNDRDSDVAEAEIEEVYDTNEKSFWQRIWPVAACGAGLFSDGYVNNVIGSVSTILSILYGARYTQSTAKRNVSSITFAGTVLGQLVFGYTSDRYSRKWSLMISTVILFVFTALAAGSYGVKGDIVSMFSFLTAWRFFVGVGIGGEYPAGSVACAESTSELRSGTRNRWFVLFTNTAIDWGFVIGAFVPYIVVVACGESHLRAAWRIMLGIGCVWPLSLIYFRFKLDEPESFKRENMKRTRTPYWLALKFYGPRLFFVSLIWFIYDFSTYSFGIYSTTILANIIPDSSLAVNFGWNTVINLFYIPGTILGAFVSDWIGPKYGLILGVTLQGIVGFIMSGLYDTLAKPSNVAAFCVVYGIFLSLGELGPGDNIGLLASKTSATAIRGKYYGIAAAVGKIGAFVGTYVFPSIEKAGHNSSQSAQYPFYVSSALCIFSAIIAFLFIPNIKQNTIQLEDVKFRNYLRDNGFDIGQLGEESLYSEESRVSQVHNGDLLPPNEYAGVHGEKQK